MSNDVSLGDAVARYVARLSQEERDFSARELNRFARWYGFERPLGAIQPADLERYQEQLGQTGVDTRKLEPLRQFLSDARQKRLIDGSLAVHVRIKRKSARQGGRGGETDAPTLQVTQAGFENLKAELQRLDQDVRPKILEDMKRAAADKDMRENAPYHAAKEELAQVQSRMNMLQASLAAATIVDGEHSNQRVGMGSTVSVRDLADNEELVYTLVGPGEIDLHQGRISIQSPFGKALADRAVGDQVEVETPSGRQHYRVERIEAS